MILDEIRWVKITEALALPRKDKAEQLADILVPFVKLTRLERDALKDTQNLSQVYMQLGPILSVPVLRETIRALVRGG